jgi:transcriptional regulator with XRE-family HTH domain
MSREENETIMKDRIRLIREKLGMTPRDMERETGIDRYTWTSVERGKQRVNEDHLAALEKIAPQYLYWVVTGKTLPESGQISPEIVDKCEELLRDGTDG